MAAAKIKIPTPWRLATKKARRTVHAKLAVDVADDQRHRRKPEQTQTTAADPSSTINENMIRRQPRLMAVIHGGKSSLDMFDV